MADPGFARGGCQPQRRCHRPVNLASFSWKMHENEENWHQVVGRASLTPPWSEMLPVLVVGFTHIIREHLKLLIFTVQIIEIFTSMFASLPMTASLFISSKRTKVVVANDVFNNINNKNLWNARNFKWFTCLSFFSLLNLGGEVAEVV